jgi:excisionase family DNA binding protein
MTAVTANTAAELSGEPIKVSVEISADVLELVISAVTERVLATRVDDSLGGGLPPEWMTVENAARYLDMKVERLRKLVAYREVPFHQEAPGCRIYFRRRDLDEWMASFRQPHLR